MRINAISAASVDLPFRLAFGHHLARRKDSRNVVVKVLLDDGTAGYGESVPRSYVTGEDAEGALERIRKLYAPPLIGLEIPSWTELLGLLEGSFMSFGLDRQPLGASWCALELAVLDAVARSLGRPLADLIGPAQREKVRYGAVVPFLDGGKLKALLRFYKLYGFKTVKVKVGRALDQDFKTLQTVRQIFGPDAVLRVDANCAWNYDQAMRACEKFKELEVSSFEQPLPAHDVEGMARLTSAIDETVIADESLCTLSDAETLASGRACSGYNVRISKVGGLLAARKMAAIARKFGLSCHLGAQVGESGILSAAGRLLALLEQPFDNYEGSANRFLLRQDLVRENLTVSCGAWGGALSGPGLGVTFRPPGLANFGAGWQNVMPAAGNSNCPAGAK